MIMPKEEDIVKSVKENINDQIDQLVDHLQKPKKDNRATLKIPKELKQKMEAQKQAMGLKFDYQVLEILLEHNFETFSDAQKSMYKVLLDVYKTEE